MRPRRLLNGWYRLECGRYVPGVTTVLGAVMPPYHGHAGLLRGEAVARETARRDRARLCGNPPRKAPSPEALAWETWLAEVAARVRLIEEPVCNRQHGYAGRLDRLVEIRREPWLVDIKTGAPADWHRLQTAAYAGCLAVRARRVAVYLRPDGTYRARIHDDPGDWPEWLELLREYRSRLCPLVQGESE